jgi:hypothetical protein
MGKQFDGRGKVLQGFSGLLCLCCYLAAVSNGKVLVTETVLWCLKCIFDLWGCRVERIPPGPSGLEIMYVDFSRYDQRLCSATISNCRRETLHVVVPLNVGGGAALAPTAGVFPGSVLVSTTPNRACNSCLDSIKTFWRFLVARRRTFLLSVIPTAFFL